MKKISILIILFMTTLAIAQNKSFDFKISNDTVLADNYLIIRFDIINLNGDFTAPEFYDFDILRGPNTSSIFSIVNGESTQKTSYTYYLQPKKEGELFIEPAYLYTESDTLETSPVTIIVLPNPESKKIKPILPEENDIHFFSPSFDNNPLYPKKRKKYKTEKKKKKLKTRKL